MQGCLKRHDVLGLEVDDRNGAFVGKVLDTYPLDGGGEIDLLLVNVGRRFPRRRLVPTEGMKVRDGRVRLGVMRDDVEDAPSAEDHRWADPADVARGYWITAGD